MSSLYSEVGGSNKLNILVPRFVAQNHVNLFKMCLTTVRVEEKTEEMRLGVKLMIHVLQIIHLYTAEGS